MTCPACEDPRAKTARQTGERIASAALAQMTARATCDFCNKPIPVDVEPHNPHRPGCAGGPGFMPPGGCDCDLLAHPGCCPDCKDTPMNLSWIDGFLTDTEHGGGLDGYEPDQIVRAVRWLRDQHTAWGVRWQEQYARAETAEAEVRRLRDDRTRDVRAVSHHHQRMRYEAEAEMRRLRDQHTTALRDVEALEALVSDVRSQMAEARDRGDYGVPLDDLAMTLGGPVLAGTDQPTRAFDRAARIRHVYDVLSERAPSDIDIEAGTNDAPWWLALRDAIDAVLAGTGQPTPDTDEVERLQAAAGSALSAMTNLTLAEDEGNEDLREAIDLVREAEAPLRVALLAGGDQPTPDTRVLTCPECTIDEDPLPWCDCEPGQTCDGPCRRRAHAPARCPLAAHDTTTEDQ